MINAKKIYNSILNDERILQVVNDENIMDVYPKKVTQFPCIIFFDGNQNNTEYADNEYHVTRCNVEVHIFTKSLEGYPTTSEVGIILSDIFEENDFSTISNTEVSDPQPDVKHRIINYRKEIFL